MLARAPGQSADSIPVEGMPMEPLLPIDEWYDIHAARVDGLAGTAEYGYAQGHAFAALLGARANRVVDSLDQEEVQPNGERILARHLLADSFTATANFLDIDPQDAPSDMGIILQPRRTDSDMTHTVVDEIEAILDVEPTEDDLVFSTAIRGVYLLHEQAKDKQGNEHMWLRLVRASDHENLLSGFGYPRETKHHQLKAETLERLRQEGDIRADVAARDTQNAIRSHAPNVTLIEPRSQRQEAISGSTGEYFTTLATRLRENTGSSSELDRFESRVQQLSTDERPTFTGNTDNHAEQAVRLNVEQAAVSAASFFAPRRSGRMPQSARLLEISPDELSGATSSDETVQRVEQEIMKLLGVPRHGKPQMMRIGDARIFSEPTMFSGVTLMRSWKLNEQGGYGQFEAWLERS